LLFVALFFSLYLAGTTQGQSCPAEGTPTDMLGPFYVANSRMSGMIGPDELLRIPEQRLIVSGRVLSSMDCSLGVAGVSVEVWYAGQPDSDGNFYQDDEYRGQVVTDDCGYYNFTQTFPALYPTRPILHSHFRLSKDDQELLVTQMYFIGEGSGYVDRESRQLQAVEVNRILDGSRSVEFDIFVDMEGDSSVCGDDVTSVQNTDSVTPTSGTATTVGDEQPNANVANSTGDEEIDYVEEETSPMHGSLPSAAPVEDVTSTNSLPSASPGKEEISIQNPTASPAEETTSISTTESSSGAASDAQQANHLGTFSIFVVSICLLVNIIH